MRLSKVARAVMPFVALACLHGPQVKSSKTVPNKDPERDTAATCIKYQRELARALDGDQKDPNFCRKTNLLEAAANVACDGKLPPDLKRKADNTAIDCSAENDSANISEPSDCLDGILAFNIELLDLPIQDTCDMRKAKSAKKKMEKACKDTPDIENVTLMETLVEIFNSALLECAKRGKAFDV